MAPRGNTGIAALSDVAGIGERSGAYHAGFMLGPRVNAGGRVGEADLGARLLSTDDPAEARALAVQLDTLNAERRQIEARVLDAAVARSKPAPPGADRFRGGRGLASRRHRHRRQPPQGALRSAGLRGGAARRDRQGLGRSVAGFPIGPAIIAAQQAGLLINGGGHAMAAGLTVTSEKLDEFRATINTRAAEALGDGSAGRRALDRRRAQLRRGDGRSLRDARSAGPVRHRQFRAALCHT